MEKKWISGSQAYADAAPVPKLQKIAQQTQAVQAQAVGVKKGAPVPGMTPMTTTPATPSAQPRPSAPPTNPAPKK